MDKIKVILFGMTGQGNNAFKVLRELSYIDLLCVFTPGRQDSPFPYYQCEKLQDLVQSTGIPLYEDLPFKGQSGFQVIRELNPDLIVVSTFNQIIPEAIIRMPKLGVVNVHPSLLPKYRGATPTVWTLANGEEETGVTVHFIESEKIDSGRIIMQHKLRIDDRDTDGMLRHKLASLSEKTLAAALDSLCVKGENVFQPQDEAEATYFPKRTINDAELNLNAPFKNIYNKTRAMTPHPGAYIIQDGQKYKVRDAVLVKAMDFRGGNSIDGRIVVQTLEGMVQFSVA